MDESSKTLVVKATMQREVDAHATSSTDTHQQIWDAVSAQFYNRDDNVIVRVLTKAQVTKRVHRTRAEHFGSDVHGRVEVPPLLNVKRSNMVFDQATNCTCPCIFYVLAASKTFESYWNIFQYIRDACGQRLDPKQVVCDSEFALMRAVEDWFTDTELVGCFVHFKQARSRKMAKMQIPKREIKNAMEEGSIDMLTVVEPTKIAMQGVSWVRTHIKARCDNDGVVYSAGKWRKFWAYFAKTWVDLLKPDIWNVHRRDVVARTNLSSDLIAS